MARKRSIKPEFFNDVDLAEVSIEARFLYAGMWPWMDRQGVIEADPRVHRANVFPHDERVTAQRVQGWLQELVEAGFVVRFSWQGKDLLFCPTFNTHQKLFPDERARFEVAEETLRNALLPAISTPAPVSVPGMDSVGSEQEPVRVEVEVEVKEKEALFDFSLCYDAFPRKRGKDAGLKRLHKRYGRDAKARNDFMAAVKALAHECKMQRTDPKFIPYFSTFVGTDDAEPWRDYVPPEKPTPPPVAVPVEPEKPAERFTPEVGAQAVQAIANLFKSSNRISGAS